VCGARWSTRRFRADREVLPWARCGIPRENGAPTQSLLRTPSPGRRTLVIGNSSRESSARGGFNPEVQSRLDFRYSPHVERIASNS
jgi:hypothetical protein